MLYRGNFRLPHMFQSLGHDGYADEIAAHAGGLVYGYMLADEQYAVAPAYSAPTAFFYRLTCAACGHVVDYPTGARVDGLERVACPACGADAGKPRRVLLPAAPAPYRFLCYSPRSSAQSWTAFHTRQELQDFCDAYRIKLEAEPVPGQTFRLRLPRAGAEPLPLTEDLVLEGGPDLLYPADKLRKLMAAGAPLSGADAVCADEHGNLRGGRAEAILRAAGWTIAGAHWHPPRA